MSIRTLLIADRGQAARRIIGTARRMGLRTVAVYAEDDRLAPHVEEADVAVPLGAGPVTEAYRNRGALLDAAAWQGADAVHPGRGPLAASAPFAKAATAAGLTWVGATAEVARLVDDELALRLRAAAADVPMIERVLLPGDGSDGWADAVAPLGYPLVVAGAAGADGRSRWRVDERGALGAAVDAARRDARGAGADTAVVAEPLLVGAVIVEVPVIADGHGQVVALPEIERATVRQRCTVVARTPSPRLDRAGRDELADIARRLTAATGFRGVGSVVLATGTDAGSRVLDLIPALTGGHPAVEEACRLDLVRVQLELAGDDGVGVPVEEDRPSHPAIVVHVRARSTGVLHGWRHGPTPGVRHDDSVARDTTVTAGHDPLLTSLTAAARSPAEAAARLGRALRELQVHGVDSDRDVLIDVLAGDDRPTEEDDPATYERQWQRFNALIGPHLAAAALAGPARPTGPWPFAPSGWRNVGGSVREMRPGESTWRITPTRSGFASQTVAFERRGERWEVSYCRVQRDHPLAVRRRTDPVATPSDLFNVAIGGPTGHTTTIVELIRLDEEVTLVHFGRRGHRCTVHVVGDRYYVNSALGQSEFRQLPRHAAP